LFGSQAQQAALALPKVGYATNADHGAGCNIHPPPKQYCGKRLAESAMAIVYGKDVMWKSPSFKSQVAATNPPSVTVTLQVAKISSLHFLLFILIPLFLRAVWFSYYMQDANSPTLSHCVARSFIHNVPVDFSLHHF
jgi:hypothetical protein